MSDPLDFRKRVQKMAAYLAVPEHVAEAWLLAARKHLLAIGRWCCGCERPLRACRCLTEPMVAGPYVLLPVQRRP